MKQEKKVRTPFLVALLLTVVGVGGLVTYNAGANSALNMVVELCSGDTNMMVVDNTIFDCRPVGSYSIGEPL